AVTCRPESPIARRADATLAVPEADERAIVMTRSFNAQAALLMRLGTVVAEHRGGATAVTTRFAADLDTVPDRWAEVEPHIERALELALERPSRVVVLGGGAAHGI